MSEFKDDPSFPDDFSAGPIPAAVPPSLDALKSTEKAGESGVDQERSTARTEAPASDPIPVCTCSVRVRGARTICPEHAPVDREDERTTEARLDDYLTRRLQDFAGRDAISLPVYYRVSPQFIAAVRAQRIELARLRIENAELREFTP